MAIVVQVRPVQPTETPTAYFHLRRYDSCRALIVVRLLNSSTPRILETLKTPLSRVEPRWSLGQLSHFVAAPRLRDNRACHFTT